MSKNNVLIDVASLRGRVAVTSTRKVDLHSGPSAASCQIEKDTAELCQARDTISTQSKDMAKIVRLKTSIKLLEDNVEFYEASKEILKS